MVRCVFGRSVWSARVLIAGFLLAGVVMGDGCASTGRVGVHGRVFRFAVVNGERAPVPDIRMGDARTIRAILDEGMNRNEVMDHLTYLTTRIGARLTGSSAAERANNWTRDQFESWGLANAHLEQWGTISMRFDRGPSRATVYRVSTKQNDEGEAETVENEIRQMQFTWLAWSRGTDGPVRGPIVRMPETLEQFEAVRERLDGAWVLLEPDYSGRTGIRGIGRRMRARLSHRQEIRQRLAAPPPSPAAVDEQAESPAAEGAPADGAPADGAVADGAPAAGDGPVNGVWTGTIKGPDAPDGVAISLTFTLHDDGSVTGSVSIPGYHEGPIKNGSFDADTGVLTYSWEHPAGESTPTLTIRGDSLTGDSPTPDGRAYEIRADRGAAEPEPETEGPDLEAMVLEAGPAGFISSSQDERVWTTSAPDWRTLTPETMPRDVEVNVSEPDYDFLSARIEEGIEIAVEFDLAYSVSEGPIPCYNTVAEIPGTQWPDQVVIISGHMDSWNGPGSQGATDNGTGSSVALEAARILAAVGAKPKRTIRFILWTGEEQGLLGSRAYVEAHKDEMAGISAVFVDDGGTNYEGGVQCIAPMADYLAAATAPVNGRFFSQIDADRILGDDNPDNDEDAGWLNVSVRTREKMPRGGGSDHASFNAVGVPGFFWNEVGRAQYRRGWHTQFDRIDLAIPEYLRQSSTSTAITAYNLACAPSLLPRQPPQEPKEQADAQE